MRRNYSVVLVGGSEGSQVINLRTSRRNAEMAFFSLSFAAVGSYDEIYLYSGEFQINKKTLKK